MRPAIIAVCAFKLSLALTAFEQEPLSLFHHNMF